MKTKHLILSIMIVLLMAGFAKAQQIGTVGNTVINDDFMEALKFIHPDFHLVPDSNFLAQSLGRSYIMPLVFADTARKLGLDKDPAVKRQLELVKKMAEDSYLAMIYQKTPSKDIQVTDAEVKKYYDDNIPQFTERGTNSYLSAKIMDTSRATVKKVKDILSSYAKKDTVLDNLRIAVPGKYFISFEKRPAMMIDPFNKSNKNIKPGEVTEPVTMGNMIMMSLLISKIPDKIKTFDEVKDVCRQNVIMAKSSQIQDDIRKKEAAKYPVKFNKDYFKAKK